LYQSAGLTSLSFISGLDRTYKRYRRVQRPRLPIKELNRGASTMR